MKKVLLLPGSAMQIPLIKKLKGKGYYVMSLHPKDNFPTKPYSDEYAIVDILNRSKCLEIAKDFAPNVVLSEECDIAMPTIAYLSKELGLSSLSETEAALYTDKSLMREFCQKHSILSPAFCKCINVSEAKDFFRSQQGKCILKPLDSNCSKGVFIVENEDDIDLYWEESISFSKCDTALLIEQYIEGVEFTIDGVVTSSGHKSLAISEKCHYDYNPNIAYELFFSNHNDNYDYEELRKINNHFVDCSTLPIGFFTHAEYKYMNGKFYLIEIGARGGGNYISSDIVPIVSGVDNYTYMIDVLVEGKIKEDICIDEALYDRCAVLYFFDVPCSGVVKEIQGLEILSDNPNVIRYDLHFKVGDTIQRANNDSARIGYYIAYAENKRALRALMEQINETFKILVE
jgi:biotin carboxylase